MPGSLQAQFLSLRAERLAMSLKLLVTSLAAAPTLEKVWQGAHISFAMASPGVGTCQAS